MAAEGMTAFIPISRDRAIFPSACTTPMIVAGTDHLAGTAVPAVKHAVRQAGDRDATRHRSMDHPPQREKGQNRRDHHHCRIGAVIRRHGMQPRTTVPDRPGRDTGQHVSGTGRQQQKQECKGGHVRVMSLKELWPHFTARYMMMSLPYLASMVLPAITASRVALRMSSTSGTMPRLDR